MLPVTAPRGRWDSGSLAPTLAAWGGRAQVPFSAPPPAPPGGLSFLNLLSDLGALGVTGGQSAAPECTSGALTGWVAGAQGCREHLHLWSLPLPLPFP